ncbi:MAG: PA2778 family cysteine peptidase [Nitrospinota bacterium]
MGFDLRSRLRGTAVPLLMAGFVAGCATLQTGRLTRERFRALPSKAVLLQVPFHPQEAYFCGPAALAMALNWSGDPVNPSDLIPQVFTPGRKGTLQSEIINAGRRHGRLVYPVSGFENLLKEVAAGHPVIVLQNLGLSWYPQWHYAVVVGYDLTGHQIVLHSGLEARKVIPLRLFERTWARSNYWSVAVLPPHELPASALEKPFLEAAAGLERARQWEAAARAYEAALQRWPKSYGALMGLGNSRYALGDLSGAERAFRAATKAHPTAAAAFNNLAHVLAERGHRREALKLARQAVALGGPLKRMFLKTLKQIQEKGDKAQ